MHQSRGGRELVRHLPHCTRLLREDPRWNVQGLSGMIGIFDVGCAGLTTGARRCLNVSCVCVCHHVLPFHRGTCNAIPGDTEIHSLMNKPTALDGRSPATYEENVGAEVDRYGSPIVCIFFTPSHRHENHMSLEFLGVRNT